MPHPGKLAEGLRDVRQWASTWLLRQRARATFSATGLPAAKDGSEWRSVSATIRSRADKVELRKAGDGDLRSYVEYAAWKNTTVLHSFAVSRVETVSACSDIQTVFAMLRAAAANVRVPMASSTLPVAVMVERSFASPNASRYSSFSFGSSRCVRFVGRIRVGRHPTRMSIWCWSQRNLTR